MTVKLHVFPDHEALTRAVAARVLGQLHEKPDSVLALPSGNTPVRLYAHLADAHRHGQHFERATIFALDEYLGLGADDPRSFAAFFRTHVFGPLGLPGAHTHVLDGRAADPEAACAAYEAAIAKAGGLDLTLLGLGANGHIAFNEPATTLSARTHVTPLSPPASAIAPRGLTLGVGTLLSAPRVWLMASGAGKAEAVARMLNGTIDPLCPASLLQAHPSAEVFVDTAAAAHAR